MPDVASVLYGRDDVRGRVWEIGRTVTADYAGRQPVLVSVLKGGIWFLADLVRAIDLPLEVHFLAISRYGDAEESLGRVQILLDLDEDIVDTGLTCRYLSSVMAARRPASFEVCTLLDKSVRRIAPITPRYVGFDCPDRFVVGYGLDFEERYRNIPDILQVNDIDALKADADVLRTHPSDP
jgi:hypoxanthine phosphoribosyltransferase